MKGQKWVNELSTASKRSGHPTPINNKEDDEEEDDGGRLRVKTAD